MINYIKGQLVYIGENNIIVENNGIGYSIFISNRTSSKLPHLNNEVKIFTYMNVKEDGISLYGFLSLDELNMFNLLITVNGIGPKGALALLSELRPSDILMAISYEDKNALAIGKGIGKKTAERIILDLKDKIGSFSVSEKESSISIDVRQKESSASDEKNDAIAGLVALGFSKIEAAKAVESVYTIGMDSSKIISIALKVL